MTPLCGIPAAAALATDTAELSAEEAKLKAEDSALIALDSKEMTDEIALKKAQDAVLSAMQKGDDKLVKELEAKVKALEGTAAADAKAKKALLAEARTLGCKRRRGGGRSAPVAALGQASGTASAPGLQGAQRSPLPFFPLQVSKEADLAARAAALAVGGLLLSSVGRSWCPTAPRQKVRERVVCGPPGRYGPPSVWRRRACLSGCGPQHRYAERPLYSVVEHGHTYPRATCVVALTTVVCNGRGVRVLVLPSCCAWRPS